MSFHFLRFPSLTLVDYINKNIRLLYHREPKNGGTEYLRRKANEGKPAAMNILGQLYLQGSEKYGITKDELEALKWLERASDAGGGIASRTLGDYHIRNNLRDKSIPYYQMSIEQGHVPAYIGLGICQMAEGKLEEGILSIRKGLICGVQDTPASKMAWKDLRSGYKNGLVTKDEYEFTLRANQESVNKCKSKGREEMKKALQNTKVSRGSITKEEFNKRFKVVKRP